MNDPTTEVGILADQLSEHLSELAADDAPAFSQNVRVPAMYIEDTTSTGEPNSFYVISKDTAQRYKVTVEHVPDAVPANSFAATMLGVEPTVVEPMTKARRKAFESRADFPGWDAL